MSYPYGTDPVPGEYEASEGSVILALIWLFTVGAWEWFTGTLL